MSEVAVRTIERARERVFELLALDTEPRCWRSFIGHAGALEWVKPDLSIVAADPLTETHTWVEVDRSTEHMPAVLRKCTLYQRYHDTGIEQLGRGVFPAIVWCVLDESRAERITQAIHASASLDSDLFIVRTTDTVIHALEPPEP